MTRAFPPHATIGDELDSTLYENVGRALSVWEWAEGNLAVLVSFMAPEGQNRLIFMRDYGENLSFTQRMKVARKCAKAHFDRYPGDESQRTEFEAILLSFERLDGYRNDLAHGIVQPYSAGGYALFPAFHATNRRPLKNLQMEQTDADYIYSSVEVRSFIADFSRLPDPVFVLISKVINSLRESAGSNVQLFKN